MLATNLTLEISKKVGSFTKTKNFVSFPQDVYVTFSIYWRFLQKRETEFTLTENFS